MSPKKYKYPVGKIGPDGKYEAWPDEGQCPDDYTGPQWFYILAPAKGGSIWTVAINRGIAYSALSRSEAEMVRDILQGSLTAFWKRLVDEA